MYVVSALRTCMCVLPLCAVGRLLVLAPEVGIVRDYKVFYEYMYKLCKNVSITILQNIPGMLLLHRWL